MAKLITEITQTHQIEAHGIHNIGCGQASFGVENGKKYSLEIVTEDSFVSERKPVINDPLLNEHETEANVPLQNVSNGIDDIRSKGFQRLKITKILVVGIAITIGVIIGFTVMPQTHKLMNPEHLKAGNLSEVLVHYSGTSENRAKIQSLFQRPNNTETSVITNTAKDMEEIEFNFLQVTIFSNIMTIPKAPLNTKIILNINVPKIYKWKEEWNLVNPEAIHSLILAGSFNLVSIDYFINIFTNLKVLELSDGRYLCDELLSDYEPLPGIHLPTRLQSLQLTSIGLPCENMYKFLVDKLRLFNISKFAIKDVSIQYDNIDLIRKFLNIHQNTLKTLSFENVNICGNTDCALFDDLNFSKLTEAKLYFSRGDMDSCKKSLANFNFASTNIFSFQSSVQCLESERFRYIRNWKDLRLEVASDLCTVI